MKFEIINASGIDAYRIGGRRRADWWAHRWHVDFWFRSWQAEWATAMWCPRSWTKAMVLKKAKRWQRHNTDLKLHEQRYGKNLKVREQRGLI